MHPSARARWNSTCRKEVSAAVLRMGLVTNQQNQGIMSVHHNAHKRRYATESELNDPRHRKEDDFVIKATPPQDVEAKASQTFILARQTLQMYPCHRIQYGYEKNTLQSCSLACCSKMKINKIVTLGLGEHGDGTLRWSANHVWFATIVESILKASRDCKNKSKLEIHYQTTEIDGVERKALSMTLIGIEPGLFLPAAVNVKFKSDFNSIDNDTVVVLLSRNNPWRQFLGNICLEKEIWPAMIICVPHDEEPTNAQPGSKGEVISRDEKSEALSRVLSESYMSHALISDPVRGSFAGGQPLEVLVDKLSIYIRGV